MNSVAVDMTTLIAANTVHVFGTDLFALEWNKNVEAQVLILDVSGFDTDEKLNSEQPVFQMLVRGDPGDDMVTAYTVIRAIHEFLIAEPTQNISGDEYQQFEPMSTIMGLGRDDEDRAVYSINYYTFRASI